MAALKTLLATTLLFSSPHAAPTEPGVLDVPPLDERIVATLWPLDDAEPPTKRELWQQYKALRAYGLPRMAKAYLNASDAFRDGIARAYVEADPYGEHPEWLAEAWRICLRESWCGKWGSPDVHKADGWAGAQVWAAAVLQDRLQPHTCEEHRLDDYAIVRRRLSWLKETGRWPGRRVDAALAVIDELEALPPGHHAPAEFSTNGGFGMMAANNLHRLGECVGPEDMADPYRAAVAAFDTFATCEVWDGPRGQRYQRECTCVDHTELWVGRGRFGERPLLSITDRSRHQTVRTQCGEEVARAYVVDEVRVAFVDASAWFDILAMLLA